MTNRRLQGNRALTRNQKVIRAFELRLQGLTCKDIGEQLGVTAMTVSNYVKEELENRITPLADEERKQQLDQLDGIYARLRAIFASDPPLYQYGKLVRGPDGEPAVDLELLVKTGKQLQSLLDSKARLTGAYKPFQTQTEVTHTTQFDAAYADLTELMEQKNRQVKASLAS
ncbi:hypothetical protein [Streptomyces phaeochromogenes]